MNYLDIITLAILAIFFVMGIRRGFSLTLIQVIGIVMVVVFIQLFGVALKRYIPLSLGIPTEGALVIGYILIFIIVMILAKVISSLLQKFWKSLSLSWLDRLLGGLLGIVLGTVFFIMLILFLDVSGLSSNLEDASNNSKIYKPLRSLAHQVFHKSLPYIPGSKEYDATADSKGYVNPV
ncbi:MAG: CvpA family protein [Candidatus Cloacimonas sp.]|nr:CvpA family protein [Candidatus Cloacimonadota bacterium]